MECGGELLREALILERRDGEVESEAGGLRVPGGAMCGEPARQALQHEVVLGRRVTDVARDAREHLKTSGLSARAELAEGQHFQLDVCLGRDDRALCRYRNGGGRRRGALRSGSWLRSL